MSHERERILDNLRTIRKGQKVVYFRGVNLRECSRDIVLRVQSLGKDLRIRVHHRRIAPPIGRGGQIDWTHGVGKFEYIAIGR